MTGMLFENIDRNSNGVKVRKDGRGDAWANAHRIALGNEYLMQDVDICFGITVFGHNTAEKLFLEFEPDDYKHRTSAVRDFAIVALMDRKSSIEAAFAPNNRLSRHFYCWLCRVFTQYQGIAPRFFFAIGGQEPPWRIVEVDVLTDETTEAGTITRVNDWAPLWKALNLIDLRNQLRKWLLAKECDNAGSISSAG